ncbi:MAG: ParB/RepB/Spo0J family partition protein [Planctomycetia bacterium]
MNSRKKLGRGLQSLLGVDDDAPTALLDSLDREVPEVAGAPTRLPIDAVDLNPFQPRRDFHAEELAELARSIAVHGVLQPILVRATGGNRYQLVAGERRLRAAQEAGCVDVPVRVLDIDDRQTFECALVENMMRQDLNPIEKATAFQEYVERYGSTHEELASQIGVDRSTVTNFMRLLDLPEAVQQAVSTGRISNGHARALAALGDDAAQTALCQRIVAEGLSVRQTEALVKTKQPATAAAPPKPPARRFEKSNHILSLESDLRHRFGAKVEIVPRAKDKGIVTIHFENQDDFDRVMDVLFGPEAA